MHHESYISRLIYRHLIGTITPEEASRLRQWLDESEDNRLFLDSLADPLALTDEHHTRRVVDPLRPAATWSCVSPPAVVAHSCAAPHT